MDGVDPVYEIDSMPQYVDFIAADSDSDADQWFDNTGREKTVSDVMDMDEELTVTEHSPMKPNDSNPMPVQQLNFDDEDSPAEKPTEAPAEPQEQEPEPEQEPEQEQEQEDDEDAVYYEQEENQDSQAEDEHDEHEEQDEHEEPEEQEQPEEQNVVTRPQASKEAPQPIPFKTEEVDFPSFSVAPETTEADSESEPEDCEMATSTMGTPAQTQPSTSRVHKIKNSAAKMSDSRPQTARTHAPRARSRFDAPTQSFRAKSKSKPSMPHTARTTAVRATHPMVRRSAKKAAAAKSRTDAAASSSASSTFQRLASQTTAATRSRAKSVVRPATAAASSTSARSKSRPRSVNADRPFKPTASASRERLMGTTKASAAKTRAPSKEREVGAKRKGHPTVGQLTKPKSPKFNERPTRKATVMSTEERILAEIQEAKIRQDEERQENARKVKRVLENVGKHMPTRSTKGLTEPQEFSFSTAKRATVERPHSAATPQPQRKSRKQLNGRPSTAPRQRTVSRSTTEPKPFNFASRPRKTNPTPAKSPQKKVEHITRSSTAPSPFRPTQTHPHSPMLSTSKRVKPATVMSTSEREELEMKDMPQFKARPINDKVMNSCGDLGVPKVNKAKMTEPVGFNLSTDQRASARPAKTPQKEQVHRFKARPMPDPHAAKNFNGPRVTPRALTKPVSPNISKSKAKEPKQEEEPQPFKARPMPISSGFEVRKERVVSEPKPFNLESEKLHKLRLQQLAAQRAQEEMQEKKAREFKAKPIEKIEKVITRPYQPMASDRPVTQPQPFPLRSVELHEFRKEELEAAAKHQMEEEELAAQSFRARPMPNADPFMVKRSEKPMTQPEPFHLESEERRAERARFEADLAQRRAEAAEAQARAEAQKRLQEDEELKRLRKQMQFKARPVPKPRAFVLQQSNKELTMPKSPEFATKQRERAPIMEMDVDMENAENVPLQ